MKKWYYKYLVISTLVLGTQTSPLAAHNEVQTQVNTGGDMSPPPRYDKVRIWALSLSVKIDACFFSVYIPLKYEHLF